MVIARLYEGERDPKPPSLRRLLFEVSIFFVYTLCTIRNAGSLVASIVHTGGVRREYLFWLSEDCWYEPR